MRIIQVQYNCSTEQEFYQMLGNILLAQKLLNDYLSEVKEETVGPEGYAEEWMKNFNLSRKMRDEVSNLFFCTLLAIARSGD